MIENYYKLNTLYSITINPCDKYQYFMKPDRLPHNRNLMYERLIQWGGNDINYYLIAELSEPHQNMQHNYNGSRLHLHGFIYFLTRDSLLGFLLYGLSTMLKIGQIDIDTCKDIEKWYNYITKQKLIPKKYRKYSNYDNFNDFINPVLQQESKKE